MWWWELDQEDWVLKQTKTSSWCGGGPLTYRGRTIPGSREQKESSQKLALGWFGQETDAEGREGGWELKLLHRADELGLER
jgi:hypothetical protein